MHPHATSEVEIEAVLLPTSVDGDQLDAMAEKLRESPFISQALWSPSTTE